ncbi:MAG: hypothetical protein ACI9HX_001291, partial [Pseudoalteromonas tetraodonis]
MVYRDLAIESTMNKDPIVISGTGLFTPEQS